jgi:hypothetical protein
MTSNADFLQQYLSGNEPFVLSSGVTVQIPKYSLSFKRWGGDVIPNAYRKPFIELDGNPLFAELAVLRMFQKNGWSGVWVDSYGKKYRNGLPSVEEPVALPVDKEKIISLIRNTSGRFGGCWDVFIWKGDRILFLELKQKNEPIKDSQRDWLESSFKMNFTPENFALIEWRVDR